MEQKQKRAVPNMTHTITSRDPEDRTVPEGNTQAMREKNMDKTLADSFPTSDPPSSIPNPSGQE